MNATQTARDRSPQFFSASRVWLLTGVFALVGFTVAGGVPCAVLAAQPACSVIISPGPTTDVLDAVTVAGVATFTPGAQSRLLMATIAVKERFGWRAYMTARRSVQDDVTPRTLVFPEGELRADTQARNQASMRASMLAAEQAAFVTLFPLQDMPPVGVEIVAHTTTSVLSNWPVGTLINRLNGVPVSTVASLTETVGGFAVGSRVTLSTAAGMTLTVALTQGAGAPLFGVYLADVAAVPFEVEVEAGVVGGPSAGLLFGIAIVEQLTSEQLIGPVTVSGTGTLSADGSVGAVGGIRQKLFQAGSRDSDVAVFLLPQANLGELRHVTVERDLVVVPVATLQQALDALGAVARGETPNGAVTLRA